MDFGIDFGSTYTLVSYYKNNKIKFIKFKVNNRRTKFLPTSYSKISNLKRLIEELSYKSEKQHEFYIALLHFFKFLKKNIQHKFKNQNINCVLTIPVRFNDISKNLIKKAAIEVGFFVLKLLCEPIAAGFYALRNQKNGNYLIYDLGGGTFDISLIKKHNDVYQILKIDGLSNFGGVDIDRAISQKLNITMQKARKIKEHKNHSDQIKKIIKNSLQQTFELSEKYSNNIEGVVLVGGSSKLNCIKEYFQKKFNIIQTTNQTIVAIGSALFAKNLIEQNDTLIDIIPFNLGIELLNEEIEIIIEQNHPVPIIKTKNFQALTENTIINILQGSGNFEDYISLAKFNITKTKNFNITFAIDLDGILSIKIFDDFFQKSFIISTLNTNQEYKNYIDNILNNHQTNLNEAQQKFIDLLKNISLNEDNVFWIKEKYNELFK